MDEELWKRLNELEKEEEEGGKEDLEEGVKEGGKEVGQEAKGNVHTKSVVVVTQGTPTTAVLVATPITAVPVATTTSAIDIGQSADIKDSCSKGPTPLRLLFSHSGSQSVDQPSSRVAEQVSGVFVCPSLCDQSASFRSSVLMAQRCLVWRCSQVQQTSSDQGAGHQRLSWKRRTKVHASLCLGMQL